MPKKKKEKKQKNRRALSSKRMEGEDLREYVNK